MLSDLKKTHVKEIMMKVNNEIKNLKVWFFTFDKLFSKNITSKHNNIPWVNPQKIKFQAAPCHNPPSTIVIKRFLSVKIFENLDPPNAIYK